MSDSKFTVNWPSGDCIPILATKITALELARRGNFSTFRAEDDLDWFSGVLVGPTEIGTILVMQHDGNPQKLTVFYVDANADLARAESEVLRVFLLRQTDIFWRRE